MATATAAASGQSVVVWETQIGPQPQPQQPTASSRISRKARIAPTLTRKDLSKYFHRPISEVAKELGICETMLKKMCREQGINRWPHRKIASLTALIHDIEESLAHPVAHGMTPEMRAIRLEELAVVRGKLRCILEDPSTPIDVTRAVAVPAASCAVSPSPPDSPLPRVPSASLQLPLPSPAALMVVQDSPVLPMLQPATTAAMAFDDWALHNASPLARPLTEFLATSVMDDTPEKTHLASRPTPTLFFPK